MFMRRWAMLGALALLTSSLHARENAVLRSGFAISHDHRQQLGAVTRLFFTTSDTEYVDVETEKIVSFEREEPLLDTQHAASADSSPTPTFTGPSSPDLNHIVEEAARRNQLDSDFIHAVIHAESRGNSNAVSRKGAQGLMQLMPKTAAKLGVTNSFDANENVNAGTGRVQQYHGIPPCRETRAYISSIVRDFNRRKTEQERQKKSSKKAAQASTANLPATQDGN